MPPKSKEGGAADAKFQILLAYAQAAGHTLNGKHVATATGLGNSTAFAKIAAAKKSELKIPAGAELSGAMPVLITYSKLSGHKLSAKHVAAAAGIGLSTAHAKIAQAKSDSTPDVPEPKDTLKSKDNPTPTEPKSRVGQKRKTGAAVQVNADEKTAKPKGTGGRKQQSDVARAQDVEAEDCSRPSSTKHNFAVVISARGSGNTQNSANIGLGIKRKINGEEDQESNDENLGLMRKTRDMIAVVINTNGHPHSHNVIRKDNEACTNGVVDRNANKSTTMDSQEPPKAKRGRPPKKVKTENPTASTGLGSVDDTAMTEDASLPGGIPPVNRTTGDVEPGSNAETPIRMAGFRAVNDKHANVINHERSLTLDGATETAIAKEFPSGANADQKGGATPADIKYPADIDSFDSAGKLGGHVLDEVTAEAQTTFTTDSIKKDKWFNPKKTMHDVNPQPIVAGTEDPETDEISTLMDEFIDMKEVEKAFEAAQDAEAAKIARQVVTGKYMWPFE